LILAALVMLVMGFVPWATSSIMIMFVLLFLCGWFQGMGWPPCGRTMVHWWSQKERGGIVSVWNCAHNVGGGFRRCCSCWGWRGLTTGTRRCICRHSAPFCWRFSPSR
jgi:OPA family glycerol-3-phosphate transporter-like MFS transporter